MVKAEIQNVKLRFGIIGNNESLNRAIDIAIQVAPTDLSVLVMGESGVGKESFPQITKTKGIGNTAITSLQGSWYRGLMDIEYLNLFNSIFSTLLTEIDGKFEGDWWGGGLWILETVAKTCNGENYTADNCSGSKLSSDLVSIPSEYGKITIDNFSLDFASITTNNNSITVMAIDGEGGGAYNTDPLDKIGPDTNNRIATMQVKSKYSGDREIKYVTADISINNISPDSSSSSESCYVTISGKDYGSAGHEEIFMNDSRLVEKIRIIK